MRGTIRATVKYGAMPQKEKRFVKGTPQRVIKAWKTATLAKMMKRSPQPERAGASGSLTRDAERYYPLVKHLADWVSRRGEIRAWLAVLGERPRHMLQKADLLRVRGVWLEAGVAPKTINNRVSALRNLYKVLDGDEADTPCDRLKSLPTVKVPPQTISADQLNAVLRALAQRALRNGKGRPSPQAMKDRARLMVLASTGKRPIELERAQPGDVDLVRRVWVPRDAKGGFSPGTFLNDEMVIAWQAFIAADAWGAIPDHFPRRLRAAGWPADVRPYNVRHTLWIRASERGADLSDIQAAAGHKRIQTTRRHYVPVLNSRLQRLGESLDHHFGWQGCLAGDDSLGKTH